MSLPVIQVRERCPYCSRWFPRPELLRIGPHVRICQACWRHHLQTIAGFSASGMPTECGGCQRTLRELAERCDGDNLRLKLAMKDGIYQALCLPCAEQYARRRKDLFGGTPYWGEIERRS